MKKIDLPEDIKESLKRIAASKDYEALKKVIKSDHEFLKMSALKIPTTDPVRCAMELSRLQGRDETLTKLVRTLDDISKEEEDKKDDNK